MKYIHTNIISKDWKKLAEFYQDVFECKPVPPIRKQSGPWLEKGTGVEHAMLEGVHLRLPGYDDDGPTLEIYQYSNVLPGSPPAANRKGYGHLAFYVTNVESTLNKIISNGGKAIGEISVSEVKDVGVITFVYAADPEGNILEIQKWE